LNIGLNISTITAIATIATIIRIRENINIFPVSVIIVGALSFASILSVLNPNTGSAVRVN
jgi:hypothetical protein